jgi:hypothetical protein
LTSPPELEVRRFRPTDKTPRIYAGEVDAAPPPWIPSPQNDSARLTVIQTAINL